ncbi:MAG: universal stress protein [Crocinitomicaceae bacterium]|nr:universal stress protein [Crocinitomicaceae bacterium]
MNDIVMPFSFAKESVQVAEFASSLAKKFDAKIHLVGYKDADEWLARDIKTNEVVVRRHLAELGIEYELVSIPSGSDYEAGLLEYAKEIDADLIAAAYFSHGIKDLFHQFIQEMIENKHGIPVLTVNAVEVMAINSGYSFITV